MLETVYVLPAASNPKAFDDALGKRFTRCASATVTGSDTRFQFELTESTPNCPPDELTICVFAVANPGTVFVYATVTWDEEDT
jgi:hypothetical protein